MLVTINITAEVEDEGNPYEMIFQKSVNPVDLIKAEMTVEQMPDAVKKFVQESIELLNIEVHASRVAAEAREDNA